MRVLTVLTYYAPHWTGLTAHAVRLAEGLAARGHDVTVLTSRHAPELAAEEVVNGVRVVRLRTVARFSRGMIAPGFPLALWKLLDAHDVVHLHTPLPEALLAAGLAWLQDRPCVMTHHGDIVMPAGVFERVVERAAAAIHLGAGALAYAVTSYSADYAASSRLLRRLSRKVRVIAPPVSLTEPDRAAAAEWRAELGLRDKTVLAFAGRWVEEKGFDLLLRALPRIRAEVPDAHLVYAGEPAVYEDFFARCAPLLESVKEHVTLLGLLRDERRMAAFHALADLFVLPSRSDMLALVQVEAMLAGTPVVAADVPGARVLVKETGFGRLAPPGDPDALARTVVATLRERARYLPRREEVARRFDPEASIAANEALLLEACRERAEAPRPALEPLLAPLLESEADMAFRRRARFLLEALAPEDGERILDCGTGGGFYLRALRALGAKRVLGVDVDRAKLREARGAGAPLARADAASLPFADASFDKLLATEVLEHLEDDRRALAEMRRVLKPGGLLALSVPHARYPFLWDPINRVWSALGGAPIRSGPLVGIWTGHRRLYTPEELAALVSSAGFSVDDVREATHACLPFNHFLLYGVGKPLVEKRLLPSAVVRRLDRRGASSPARSRFHPLSVLLAVLEAVDRPNDEPAPVGRTYVNVLLTARKPA